MNIDICIFANLRDILGIKQKSIQIEKNSTVQSILNLINSTWSNGKEFYDEVVDASSKKLKDYVKIILNGQILFAKDALQTRITQENSNLSIFPPLGGG